MIINKTLTEEFHYFSLRSKLTSDLILKYKKHKSYQILLTLIKSELHKDLVLAQEIMNKLAILEK